MSSELESSTLPGLQKSNSLRPQRKAKNRDAIQKHLNRDVDLLILEKNEKKSSTKKSALNPMASNQALNQSGSKFHS
jgi:hypothetical protein